MSHSISHRIPPEVDVLFPINLESLGGPFVKGRAELNAERGERGIGCLTFVEQTLTWIEDFDFFVFQILPDGTKKAIRLATAEDIKAFRVPRWIQGEEVPICCDREMVFVGQIDDHQLCVERPDDAKVWWHDAASFYVFTCANCLSVTAVGQQY
jgi:hypothetical protein